MALRLTQTLLRAGLSGKELALLSPYRQQNKVLGAGILQLNEVGAKDVEILTADRAQGRDYEAVIVSLVRANDEGHVGALLTDERRINVALTRARSKLILVGCARTLRGSPILAAIVELMEQRGWVYELETGEEHLHDEHAAESDRSTADPSIKSEALDAETGNPYVKAEDPVVEFDTVASVKKEEPDVLMLNMESDMKPSVKIEHSMLVDLPQPTTTRSVVHTQEPDIIDVDADSDVELAPTTEHVPAVLVKAEAHPVFLSGEVIDLSDD